MCRWHFWQVVHRTRLDAYTAVSLLLIITIHPTSPYYSCGRLLATTLAQPESVHVEGETPAQKLEQAFHA